MRHAGGGQPPCHPSRPRVEPEQHRTMDRSRGPPRLQGWDSSPFVKAKRAIKRGSYSQWAWRDLTRGKTRVIPKMALEAPPRFPWRSACCQAPAVRGGAAPSPEPPPTAQQAVCTERGFPRLPGGITGQTPHQLPSQPENCSRRRSGCRLLHRMLRIEERSACQHGTGHSEQPSSDGPQGTGVVVALQSQRVVLGAADPVVLHGNPAPVIDSIIETAVGGQTSYDDAPVAVLSLLVASCSVQCSRRSRASLNCSLSMLRLLLRTWL